MASHIFADQDLNNLEQGPLQIPLRIKKLFLTFRLLDNIGISTYREFLKSYGSFDVLVRGTFWHRFISLF